jgi:IclR family acetate operon transcriptional repressor
VSDGAEAASASPSDAAVADASAGRAAHALALILEREPRTLTELAQAVGATPVEAAALIDALERHELVAWADGRSGLRAGPAALRFARSGVGREDLAELAQPSIRRLADESGETANLIVPRPAGTEAIAQVDGRHLLGATNWVGRELPLHCTAAGKVFLAFGVAVLADGPLSAPARATIVDRGRLARALDTVRAEGDATIVDELEDGLAAVAAPVRDRDGAVIAALTVSGATLRLPPARLRLLGRVALEQARALSRRLGYGSGGGGTAPSG